MDPFAGDSLRRLARHNRTVWLAIFAQAINPPHQGPAQSSSTHLDLPSLTLRAAISCLGAICPREGHIRSSESGNLYEARQRSIFTATFRAPLSVSFLLINEIHLNSESPFQSQRASIRSQHRWLLACPTSSHQSHHCRRSRRTTGLRGPRTWGYAVFTLVETGTRVRDSHDIS